MNNSTPGYRLRPAALVAVVFLAPWAYGQSNYATPYFFWDTQHDAPGKRQLGRLLVTLPPASYTVQVSGVGNTAGIALVEIYEVP